MLIFHNGKLNLKAALPLFWATAVEIKNALTLSPAS